METFSHETLDPNWVTGFSDGNAAFTYSRSGRQLALYFGLKLPAGDRKVLEGIQRFFGVGSIYDVKPRTGVGRAAAYYRVTHREDLRRIVEHFNEYPLRSRKQHLYEIWRQMVQLRSEFRKPDRNGLDALADELSRRARAS